MQYYYYSDSGTKYGPCPQYLIKQLVDSGQIHTQTVIETDDGRNFRAGESVTLFPREGPAFIETSQENNVQYEDGQWLQELPKEFSRVYLFSDRLHALMIAVAFISSFTFFGVASETSGLFATITVVPVAITLCVTLSIFGRIIRSQAMNAKLLYLIYERLLDD